MDLAFFREAEEETLPLTAQRSVPETPVRYKLDNSSSALRVIPQRISLSAVGATESSVEATRSKHSRIVKVAEDTVLTPSEVANHALQAFVNCVIDLARSNNSGRLREFTMHPAVIDRFGDNFKVRMGFGMHVGWAIEGAIGTKLKIDATYISPHVEMSDRLGTHRDDIRLAL
mmetsp:Transcript_3238/g.12970  ORF Transcript_3238/g.12970 Transcript_3238/m.12970 type:complete len:173 (-) Transcript_3238:12-530(-)